MQHESFGDKTRCHVHALSRGKNIFCKYKTFTTKYYTNIFIYHAHLYFSLCYLSCTNTTDHDSNIPLHRTIKNPKGVQTQMQFESFFREQPRCKMAQKLHDFDVWCFLFSCAQVHYSASGSVTYALQLFISGHKYCWQI